MKTTIRIAKNQLRVLFYSPLAWTAIVCMYFVSALTYFEIEDGSIEAFLRGGYSLQALEFLTFNLVKDMFLPDIFRSAVLTYLYLFLPLITMGIFSNEFRNGTDKLLFSSPVKTRQIVLGKYLGLLLFNIFIVASIGLMLMYIGLNVSHADWGIIFCSLLASYLLIMLLGAMGMFISSLTSYQVVAGMITVISFSWLIMYLVRFIRFLGQSMALFGENVSASASYLIDYIYIDSKMLRLFLGDASSRDLIYFFNISALFVALTLIRLKFRRQKMSFKRKLGYQLSAFAVVFIIGFLSHSPYLKFFIDFTRDKRHSLSPVTKEVIKSMNKGPLEVTYYANLMDPYSYALLPFDRVMTDMQWEKYQVYKPDINIEYKYYYNHKGGEPDLLSRYPGLSEKQIAEKIAYVREVPINWFRSSNQMNGELDLSSELYRNVARLNYLGRQTYLRLFPTPPNPLVPYFPEEREVAPALNRLIGSQPVINFSAGHAEMDPHSYGARGMKTLLSEPIRKYAMINQGIDSDTITLDHRIIPDTSKVLAICAPLLPLSEDFMDRFDYYLNNEHKNMFIGIDPDKRDIMQPLLHKLGIKVREGVLGRANSRISGEEVSGILTSNVKNFSKSIGQYFEKEIGYLNDSIRVGLTRAASLVIERDAGFTAEPFIVLDTVECFNRPGAKSVLDMEGILRKQSTDEVQPFSIAYKLSRKVGNSEQRIVVMGNLGASNSPENAFGRLAADIFGWLMNDKYPVDLLQPEPLDKSFDFKVGSVKTRKLIWLYSVTGALILVASVILIRRAGK